MRGHSAVQLFVPSSTTTTSGSCSSTSFPTLSAHAPTVVPGAAWIVGSQPSFRSDAVTWGIDCHVSESPTTRTLFPRATGFGSVRDDATDTHATGTRAARTTATRTPSLRRVTPPANPVHLRISRGIG